MGKPGDGAAVCPYFDRSFDPVYGPPLRFKGSKWAGHDTFMAQSKKEKGLA